MQMIISKLTWAVTKLSTSTQTANWVQAVSGWCRFLQDFVSRQRLKSPPHTAAVNAKARVFRYVPHDQIPEYERMGYVCPTPIKGHHGFWSVIMERPDDNPR
tara:strand:- start:9310 stop:9615 length:306 start_codon:yes stop_codon:yes gene_type:complete